MKAKKIYFVGIKGVGMSGLAVIAYQLGHQVQGSDLSEEFISDKNLQKYQISVDIGFDKRIDRDCDLVVYTAAHQGKNNPQVKQAIKDKIKVQSYGEALSQFIQENKVIAVSGTHGKTTTTAMIAKILKDADFDPGYLIGAGAVPDLGQNSHWGKGKYFVVEADEYLADPNDHQSKPKFLYLNPYVTIILSTEYVHPDVFENPKNYWNAYKKLIKKTSSRGLALVRADEPRSQELIKSGESRTKVKPIYFNKPFVGLKLSVPGKYNLCNATFAAFCARFLGVDSKLIKKSLNSFQGLERRLQLISDKKIKIFDDYAHHPTEIQNALSTLRSQYSKSKIIVIFQSHTISRTKVLLNDFAKSFQEADEVIIAPIFLSAREKADNFTGQDLAQAVAKNHPKVSYIDKFNNIITYLARSVKDNDVVVFMGAGNIYQMIPKFITKLGNK